MERYLLLILALGGEKEEEEQHRIGEVSWTASA